MRIVFALTFLGVLLAGLWGLYRTPARLDAPADLRLHALEQAAAEGAHLVAVQPWLDARHYQSAADLTARLDAYLLAAREAGYLGEGSLVVFPEHVGTWLVAARAPRFSFTASSTTEAMAHLIAANPLPFAAALSQSDESDRLAAAVFRMRADRMARDYQIVFSQLARRHGVTVVGGSIVLPDPAVANGRIVPGAGPLYNVSAVFAPDGSPHDRLVRKVHPIPDEAGFTAAADAADIPVFNTPAGRLGVLICADSWHPDVYAVLEAQGAELMAVPAFLQPSGVWNQPWGGYTTGWPADVDPARAEHYTEGQAWLTHSLGGRLYSTQGRWGVTAFLRGELWDLGSDGANILVADDVAWVAGQLDGASVSALPLP